MTRHVDPAAFEEAYAAALIALRRNEGWTERCVHPHDPLRPTAVNQPRADYLGVLTSPMTTDEIARRLGKSMIATRDAMRFLARRGLVASRQDHTSLPKLWWRVDVPPKPMPPAVARYLEVLTEPMTTAQVAKLVGRTSQATRNRLAMLESEGHVRATMRATGPGQWPQKLWARA